MLGNSFYRQFITEIRLGVIILYPQILSRNNEHKVDRLLTKWQTVFLFFLFILYLRCVGSYMVSSSLNIVEIILKAALQRLRPLILMSVHK